MNADPEWKPIRYQADQCAVFCKTKDTYGGFSNMCSGYPLSINYVPVRTSEALYQAMRFPDYPGVQQAILDQVSPMAAKMVARRHWSELSYIEREDAEIRWARDRIPIMQWALRVKFAQHPHRFGELLRSTDNKPIVELSKRDSFWGAFPQSDGTLEGRNVLGRLLVGLRTDIYSGAASRLLHGVVTPHGVDLVLLGNRLERV